MFYNVRLCRMVNHIPNQSPFIKYHPSDMEATEDNSAMKVTLICVFTVNSLLADTALRWTPY